MRVIREPDTVLVEYNGVVLSGNRSFEIMRVKGVELTRTELLDLLSRDSADDIYRDGVFVRIQRDIPPVQVQLDVPTPIARHLL